MNESIEVKSEVDFVIPLEMGKVKACFDFKLGEVLEVVGVVVFG